jgi:predicted DNA-binding transcriptional regulator AlpA
MDESTTAFASAVSKLIAVDVAREVVRLLAERQKEIPPAQEFLTERQAATLLGLSPRSLEHHRRKASGPAFIKIGKGQNGPVRYRLESVRAWAEARAK